MLGTPPILSARCAARSSLSCAYESRRLFGIIFVRELHSSVKALRLALAAHCESPLPLGRLQWHLGFYRWEMTPTFRGFESFLGFYSGGEDYFKHTSGSAYDMRRDQGLRCGANCSEVAWDLDGVYSTIAFSSEAVRVISAHDDAKPLFLYLAYQAVHSPAQVPPSYIGPYTHTIANAKRRTFAGMLSCMDEGLGNVTAALKSAGLFDNLITVFTTDNGGPTTTGDGVGAQNWPLKGGKHSIWEGGVRGTAVIRAPGMQRRGGLYSNFMHGIDWLPTLCEAAGIDDWSSPLPLDGQSHWNNLLAGSGPEKHDHIVLGNSTNSCKKGSAADQDNCGFGVRVGDWKLLRGGGGIPDQWTLYNESESAPSTSGTGQPSAGTCSTVEGMCCHGGNVGADSSVRTMSQCCDLCGRTSGCAAWVLNKLSGCWLKSAPAGCCPPANNTETCRAGGPPGQPPPVVDENGCRSKPPGGGPVSVASFLYNISADPTERVDGESTAAANPRVVAQLSALLDQILETYTGAVNDPSCSVNPAWPRDPKTNRSYLGPWCAAS